MGLFRGWSNEALDEREAELDDDSGGAFAKRKRARAEKVAARETNKPAESFWRRRPHRRSSRWQVPVTWIGVGICLVPVAAGGVLVGALAGWLEAAPPIAEFEAYSPPQATMILDRQNQPVSALFEQRRFVVPIETLPAQLPEAFVAIEDERFREHFGIDPMGIARAAVVNLSRGRAAQGASTITQQTARNLLPHIGSSRTAERKVREVLTALLMEHRYSKDQILEVYLNQIYLGSGTYGVQAAAMAYFGKPAAQLTIPECAVLAGLPQSPERYSPLNNLERATARRNQVLFKMVERGVITDGDYTDAVTSEIELNPRRVAPGRAAYFVDAVRRSLGRHPALDEGGLHAAGWHIRTTMDATIQRTAEMVLREGLEQQERVWLEGRQLRYQRDLARPEHSRAPAPGQQRMARVQRIFSNSVVVDLPGGWRADVPVPEAVSSYFDRSSGLQPGEGVDIQIESVDLQSGRFRARVLPQQRLQGALVCLDARTGDVRAIVGGREYADPINLGYFNRAMQARRQVGSTFKPMIFAAGLEHGLRPESFLSDTRIQFRDGYAPQNYDRRFMGGVTMQYSLEQSRNIPTFRIAQQLGLRRVINELRRYERGAEQPWGLPLEWPIVLGTTGVTPLELAAAYHAFANGGLAKGPRLIEGVWNEERREVPLDPPPAPEQVIGATAAAQMLQMMIGVMTHGTGRDLRPRLPEELRDRVAGKSGTTDDNRDAWFAGFTPWEVVVVWIGFDTPVPLSPEQTGGKSAGMIWADFLAAAWEHKSPEERSRPWELPSGLHFAEAGRRNGVPQWRLSNAPIAPEWHPPAEPQDLQPIEILTDEPTTGPELVYTLRGE